MLLGDALVGTRLGIQCVRFFVSTSRLHISCFMPRKVAAEITGDVALLMPILLFLAMIIELLSISSLHYVTWIFSGSM